MAPAGPRRAPSRALGNVLSGPYGQDFTHRSSLRGSARADDEFGIGEHAVDDPSQVVHRELGVARPAIDPQSVRDALRNLHDPSVPLAVAREVLRDAADRAFGDTADEQLLRQVLLRCYFDPSSSHEAAARELHLSRAAYFRRLRSASERVATWLARSGYSDHVGT